jgi:hypothetical protein
MSEQQFRGTLASGGSFSASARGIDIFDPGGNPLASFGREVVSGISRDGQVLTIQRHNDTIVTLTAASITDAVGLEQYVLDTYLAPPAAPEAAPPLAFDAFETTPAQPEPAPPPPPAPPAEPAREPEPPMVVEEPAPPPAPPPPAAPVWEAPPAAEPIAPLPPDVVATAAELPRAPFTPQPPTPPPPAAYQAEPEKPKGRRWWLWGCLGCGGLIVLTIICVGVLLATEVIDPDDFDNDDDDNGNNVIVVTNTPDPGAGNATATPANGGGDATATDGGGTGNPTAETPEGVLQVGDSATVGGLEVTYTGIRTDGGGIFPPDAGNQYLILAFSVTNTTSEPAIVSTLLQFALRADSGDTYGVSLFAETQGSLDGDLAAGATLEGEVAFEVPEGGGSYVATFSDVFTGESVEWAVGP